MSLISLLVNDWLPTELLGVACGVGVARTKATTNLKAQLRTADGGTHVFLQPSDG